jgi:hypothetical protein
MNALDTVIAATDVAMGPSESTMTFEYNPDSPFQVEQPVDPKLIVFFTPECIGKELESMQLPTDLQCPVRTVELLDKVRLLVLAMVGNDKYLKVHYFDKVQSHDHQVRLTKFIELCFAVRSRDPLRGVIKAACRIFDKYQPYWRSGHSILSIEVMTATKIYSATIGRHARAHTITYTLEHPLTNGPELIERDLHWKM